jgi:hypothetical protein
MQEAANAEAILVANATATAAVAATNAATAATNAATAATDAAAAEAIVVANAVTAAAAAATAATAAAVQQANAAAAQQAQQLAAAGGAPLGGPVFTLAPALANTAAFLDLTTPNGVKHFRGATEALNSEAFDFEDDSDLQVFLDLLHTKSQVWGWNAIFEIPVMDTMTATARNWNLITHYGMIPLESVRTHCTSYYATPSKRAQDSFMLCQCLLNSLSLDFLKTITPDSASYNLPAIVLANGAVPVGPLLLRIIISRAHVDSRATVSFIRTSLTKLDEKMIELDSDIVKFNTYVRTQVNNLAKRGQTTDDLLINWFKGYKVADDVEFQDLIRRKKNDYEEGKDVDAKSLMVDTDMKYRARCLYSEWAAPTKEQEQILALTARVEQLKSLNRTPKVSKAAATTTPKKSKKDNKYAWKDVLPKAGEPTTKTFEGKDYHTNCPYHKDQWVCHPVAECSKNPANANAGGRPAAAAAATGTTRLQRAQLAATIFEEGADDSDPEEEDHE